MLGFSLPKLIVLAVIIGVIWYGFKALGARKSKLADDDETSKGGGTAKLDAVDMAKCGVCGEFVPETAGDCGKPGCPQA